MLCGFCVTHDFPNAAQKVQRLPTFYSVDEEAGSRPPVYYYNYRSTLEDKLPA